MWSARFLGSAAMTVLFLATPGGSPAVAQDASAKATRGAVYNIPAQSLGSALTTFADRAGLKLLFPSQLVAGRKSPGLSGSFSPQQALGRLLAGTGLSYRFTNASTVTIIGSEQSSDATGANGATALAPIVVQGSQDGTTGYVATRSSGGTKTDTPLIKTPASVTVVTKQQIADQNAQSVSQAMRYTAGVVAEQRGVNEDSLEYLYSRGFQATTYLDGLQIPLTGFNITTRDSYLFDHVESIRGPASVLYGQTPPGGIVNIVSKQPTETPEHEVFFQTGSYGRVQGGFDFSGPIADRDDLFYRLTATGLTTGTQTDFVDQKRIGIAPAITWKPDEDTKLTINGEYQRDPEAGTFNYVPAVGTVLPGLVHIPRSFNTGDPGYDEFKKEEASVGYSFEHRFNDVWQVKQNFRYLHNDQTIHHVGDGSDYDASATSLERYAYRNFGTTDAITVDNQALATFDTGALKHQMLFGFDFQNIQYNHYFYEGSTSGPDAPPLSILNPVYYQYIPTPDFMLGTSNKQRTQQYGLYAQDQIELGKATFVGSLRQDWANTHTVSYKDGSVTDQDDQALTGRIGLIYNFDNGLAPYASYSTSFQPQSGTTDTGSALKPTDGKQYEIGLKYQPVGSDSFVTASLFDLRQTNVKVSNSLYPGSVTQTGEVRSRGVELEAHAYLTDDVQAIASYTYTDVENTKATANIQGKRPAGIPENMASLWLSYDMPENVAPGLKIMGGTRFVGGSFGNPTNSFSVPSVTLFDIGLQYDFEKQFPKAKGLTGTLNVSNLFDKTYVTCTNSTYCTYGQGRLVLAGLRYKW